ncbi:hypothetical protein ABZP36_007537 [Zizania latifolia]
MRDRSKNRKPTQRGRYLSTEAIQVVQSLRRASLQGGPSAAAVPVEPKLRRLLKTDMVAVFRELAAQGEVLQVFEEIRNEHWYKPRLMLYVDLVTVLASKGVESLGEMDLSADIKSEAQNNYGDYLDFLDEEMVDTFTNEKGGSNTCSNITDMLVFIFSKPLLLLQTLVSYSAMGLVIFPLPSPGLLAVAAATDVPLYWLLPVFWAASGL